MLRAQALARPAAPLLPIHPCHPPSAGNAPNAIETSNVLLTTRCQEDAVEEAMVSCGGPTLRRAAARKPRPFSPPAARGEGITSRTYSSTVTTACPAALAAA